MPVILGTVARSLRDVGSSKAVTLRLPGAIAQLGERLDRTQEVAGSSPASSIAASNFEVVGKIPRAPHSVTFGCVVSRVGMAKRKRCRAE
jgi:hypothetical protein